MIADSESQNDQSPESPPKADLKIYEPKKKKTPEKTKIVVNPGKNYLYLYTTTKRIPAGKFGPIILESFWFVSSIVGSS